MYGYSPQFEIKLPQSVDLERSGNHCFTTKAFNMPEYEVSKCEGKGEWKNKIEKASLT